ncbi:MAG: GNAT family N-acetyltransferase [Firmicutes bacterium]|nr:GNAT family N-acetyltransferase [Bacillota bacterium]
MNVTYTNEISVKDYNYLRKSVGWLELEKTQAQTGINNSAFVIAAHLGGKTVGVTRVVSDGGYIAIIVDVIVLPRYQGKGIGKTMMQRAMEFIKSGIKEGQFVFVNLMAAKDREPFYAQFGFEARPNDQVGAGMTQYIHYEPKDGASLLEGQNP